MGFRSPEPARIGCSADSGGRLSSHATRFLDRSAWVGDSLDEVGVISGVVTSFARSFVAAKRRLKIFGGFDSASDSRGGGVGGLTVGSILDIDAGCTIMVARVES